MKIYKENDKSRAVCECCGLVSTTFKTRDVSISGTKGKLTANILVGVCDKCDNVVTIPQQSAPKIQQVVVKEKKPVETRLPRHFIDILFIASKQVHAENNEQFSAFLVKFYIRRMNHTNGKSLVKLLETELATPAKSSSRLSLKIGHDLSNDLEDLVLKYSFKDKTEVIKAIILKIKDDIIEGKNKKVLDELKDLAVAI